MMTEAGKKLKTREHCIVCGAFLEGAVFRAANMPASAMEMPDEAGLTEDRGLELELCVCPHCGLVQFNCEPVGYYRTVMRAVGLSEAMRELRRRDFRHMRERYGLKGGKWVECGCGNGDFLRLLREDGTDAYGTEFEAFSHYEYAADLKDRIISFFPEASEEPIPGAPYDCFLSFNFLEHQPEPLNMVKSLFYSLRPGGYGLVTVPSVEYMCENARCYELIRDHIANYSLESLRYLFASCGFQVLEEGRIGIGDTLRMVVRRPEEGEPAASEEGEPAAPEEAISEDAYKNIKQSIQNFDEDLKNFRNRMRDFTAGLRKAGKRLALWGAGHQGFTAAALSTLGQEALYILDSSPMKQGRFAPVSHLPICAPEHYLEDPADVIMITAPGYVKEIEISIRQRYSGQLPQICDLLDERLR